MSILFLCGLYFICALIATFLYEKWAMRFAIVDQPNERSSHHRITPRGAGFVFVAMWIPLCFFLPLSSSLKLLLFPGLILNAVVGFCDDKRPLSVWSKFILQLLASTWFACILISSFTAATVTWLLFPVFAVACSTYVNFFNFMDGLDGLAALHSLLFFLPSLFLFGMLPGFENLIFPFLFLNMGLLAFLCFNFPPARVFMGDVGSCALGYLIGGVSLLFLTQDFHYFVASFLFLGVFLCDAKLTLMRRFLAGERVFEAHKKHAYQRLHQSGYTHRQVLLVNGLLQGIFSLLGLWVAQAHSFLSDGMGLIVMFVLFFVYYQWVEKRKPMYPLRS